MKIKLRNRLEVLMKDCGVATFEEMAQRLANNQHWKTTRTSLSRKFRDDDVTLSLSLIEAICNELQCLPGDLFETEVSEASDEFVEDLRARLQPFRYGAIRLQRKGSDSPTPVTKDKEQVLGKQTPTIGKSTPPDSLDQVVGPRVTHLHVDKLKK